MQITDELTEKCLSPSGSGGRWSDLATGLADPHLVQTASSMQHHRRAVAEIANLSVEEIEWAIEEYRRCDTDTMVIVRNDDVAPVGSRI